MVGVCVFWRCGGVALGWVIVSRMDREKYERTDGRIKTVSHSRKHAILEDLSSKTRKHFWQILKVFSQLVPAIMIEIGYQNTCDPLDRNDLTKCHTGRLGLYEVPQAPHCQLDLSPLSQLTVKILCGWWLTEHTVEKKNYVFTLVHELRSHNGRKNMQKTKYIQRT